MVMVNSKKGQDLFDSIKGNIDFVESTYSLAEKSNPSIAHSTHQKEKTLIDCSQTGIFTTELSVNCSMKNKIKNRMPWRVKKILKRFI